MLTASYKLSHHDKFIFGQWKFYDEVYESHTEVHDPLENLGHFSLLIFRKLSEKVGRTR